MAEHNFFGQFLVFGEGLRWRTLNFNLIFFIVIVKIRTVGQVFALNLLDKELAILHGAKQAPKSAVADLKLIAGLRPEKSTRIAVAASNSCENVR